MINLLMEVLKHAVMITGFVFVMMLLIEYVNVQTRGVWLHFLKQKPLMQYLIAAGLGAFPGCLGAFTIVAMYSHGIVSIGAVVAAMIATSGDETFVMLAMIPSQALIIIALTFVIGIIAGFATDKIFPHLDLHKSHRKLPLHLEEKCQCLPKGNLLVYMKKPSMQRVLLIMVLLLILIGYASGVVADDLMLWMKVTVVLVTLFLMFVAVTVPEHFLTEHLWDHIVKVHLPTIFAWTLGALLFIHILMHFFAVESWISNNSYIVLLIAALVGLVPESGPHLIFVTLFFEGTIPFSILLASSIVQDGHGMIPMLAESRRGFVFVKVINLIVGLIIGFTFLKLGY
ncbi:MAG: putative manganese transporter [Candidatus Cloacimonetes bacterium]|nr:putative manganese transporter [Candidatus Cloacimonadota bacterium]